MPRTDEFLAEQETIIRWDALDNIAHLWTTDPKVRKEWEGYALPIDAHVSASGAKLWSCAIPRDRITYKLFKKRA